MAQFFNSLKVIVAMLVYLPVTGICLIKGLSSVQKSLDRKRGTNAASRFVRDVSAQHTFRTALIWGSLQLSVGVGTMLIIGFSLATVCLPVPGVILMIMSVLMQRSSNKDQQRIKDARVVTKTGTRVAKAAGTGIALTAGAAATVATGGAAGVLIGTGVAAAGVGASRVAGKAGEMMTDVDAPDITEEDFKEFNEFGKSLGKMYGIDIDDPAVFVSKANAIGVKGSTVEEIGENALKSPVMQTLLAEKNLEPTVSNVIPLVNNALKAIG